jgi:class 3 adenylate cyclase
MVERQSPEDSIELLNTYYTLMFEAIGGQGGVINQMIGDGLMALFGAPLPLAQPEQAAVRAARDMLELVELLNAERAREGKEAIAIGVGIATGTVTAGYTGTQERATYTCIGSTVNLAARLEAQTKLTDHSVLMDQPTAEALGSEFRVEPLGPVSFKGLREPVPTFAASLG